MSAIGVNVAIIQDQKVLLTLRNDFHVWCLPGGSTEDGETIAEAAARETREETGLEVRLLRLVGLYSRPGWLTGALHIASFTGEVTGGTLQPQASEVLEMRYFGRDELPEALLLGHRQRVLDALDGVCGAVWLQDGEWSYPPEMTRADLYERMAQSGLPPEEFYRRYVGKPGPRGNLLEVSGLKP